MKLRDDVAAKLKLFRGYSASAPTFLIIASATG
jgi:hypothetical protein